VPAERFTVFQRLPPDMLLVDGGPFAVSRLPARFRRKVLVRLDGRGSQPAAGCAVLAAGRARAGNISRHRSRLPVSHDAPKAQIDATSPT
jgi:hypothetical protein